VRVLVGCEESGIVRSAFRLRGHDAYSCDLKPARDMSLFHIQADIRDVLSGKVWITCRGVKIQSAEAWDLGIFHPECRYLSNSGVLRLYQGGKKKNGRDLDRWEKMQDAAAFFRTLWETKIPRVCVENPVMHGHARKLIGCPNYAQTIQPYEFGEDASKRTCLWLRGLPKLVLDPTKLLVKDQYANQTPSGQNKLGPSPERATIRATTYQGIADAMADQWGALPL
jgi:hypothetical protein